MIYVRALLTVYNCSRLYKQLSSPTTLTNSFNLILLHSYLDTACTCGKVFRAVDSQRLTLHICQKKNDKKLTFLRHHNYFYNKMRFNYLVAHGNSCNKVRRKFVDVCTSVEMHHRFDVRFDIFAHSHHSALKKTN